MKRFIIAVALFACPASAETSLVGQYRLSAGPDVAGGLEITADHRFRYMLAAGALDERAEGRWVEQVGKVCLYTEPRPVPPAFTLRPRGRALRGSPTLLVKWPNGRGVALVDFAIGFDRGEPLTGYTQDYGWTMPEGDKRVPRWVELSVPMYGVRSPRLALHGRSRGTINVLLTPNDLGVVDFQGECLEARGDIFVLKRGGGEMRFVSAQR